MYTLPSIVMRIIIILSIILIACGCKTFEKEYINAQAELTQARDSIKSLLATIDELAYPANQRLATVQSLITKKDFDQAKMELDKLIALFPKSSEAQMQVSLNEKIEKGLQAKLEEEKRLKALGFKALKDNLSISCGNVKASFSNIGIGSTFIFDNYGYEYFYSQADKDSKYVSAAMNITSDDSDPKLPQCAIYIVDGDHLNYEGVLVTKFARWDDYGTYLGNSHDFNNDFAKVNTVKFKIGAELSNEKIKKPFVLVLKKENVLERTHSSYSRPEISYIGLADFKKKLTIEDFAENGQYVAVKRFNFEKL